MRGTSRHDRRSMSHSVSHIFSHTLLAIDCRLHTPNPRGLDELVS